MVLFEEFFVRVLHLYGRTGATSLPPEVTVEMVSVGLAIVPSLLLGLALRE